MKSPDFEAQVPALLRHAAQSNPARTHDHLPALRRQLAEAPQRAQPRSAPTAAWRRTGALAGACAVIAIAALLFTHLPRSQVTHSSTVSGAALPIVTAKEAWGTTGITSFTFNGNALNLHPVVITPDGSTLIIANQNYPCPNPCPSGTDETGAGVETYDIATHTLHSLFLDHASLGGVATDGRYVGYWEGLPGAAPNYGGMLLKAIDLATGKTLTVATFNKPGIGNTIGALSDPQVEHGLMVWAQIDNADGEEQHLYVTDLATGATQLIAQHTLIEQQHFHWPYLEYEDGTNGMLYVRNLATNTTRVIPNALAKDPNAVFVFYNLESTMLEANSTEQTATGYQLIIQSLDLTQATPAWQTIVTVPRSRYPAQVMMNARLAVWADDSTFGYIAWDRVQQRLVTLGQQISTLPNGEKTWVGNAFMDGRWLVTFLPPTTANNPTGTITIYDTAALPTHAP